MIIDRSGQDELVTQRESSSEENNGEAKVDHLTPRYETDGRLARLCTNPQQSEGSQKQSPKSPGAAARTLLALLCPSIDVMLFKEFHF